MRTYAENTAESLSISYAESIAEKSISTVEIAAEKLNYTKQLSEVATLCQVKNSQKS